MADLTVDTESTPVAPAGSAVTIYVDSTTKQLAVKDSTGFARGDTWNASVAAQSPAAATRTYITNSNLSVPTNKLQVGTCFRWVFNMTKTAAGIATSTIAIAVGTAGTTADTDRVSFTKPAGTAVVDEGWIEIVAVVRSIGATGVISGEIFVTHNLATTGHMAQQCFVANTISAGFDMTVANLIVGLTITTGAADAITIQQVTAEAWNL